MELNAEQIKKALECCHSCNEADCKDCGYRHKADGEEDLYITCTNVLIADALALITSQEQRIRELTVELDAMRGAANSYKMHNEKLTEENEGLKARVLEENHLRHQVEEILANEMSVVRADTLREFAKRLKDRAVQIPKYNGDVINAQWVDRISSEMLEDTKSSTIDKIANEMMEDKK